MKRPVSKSILLLGATLALAALSFRAGATPYASAVDTTSTPGSVSFRLNEDADSVKILFDSGTSTNDLGALTKGPYGPYSLGVATNYQIVVSKKSLNGWTAGAGNGGAATALQISSDANPLLSTYLPKGVAVNKNPKSPYFGRIYIANDVAGLTSTHVARNTTGGIYLLNADQTDAVGQGDTALKAGLAGNTDTADNTPYHLTVGEDNNLYICDWSDITGNLYQTDPNVSAGSGLLVLKALSAPNTAVVPIGTANTHGSIAACYVSGSQAAGTLSVYTIDEDLQTSKTTTSKTQLNSLWRYDVGAGALPWTADANSKVWTASNLEGVPTASVVMGLDRAPDGKFFITTLRSVGSECGLIVRSSNGATTLFHSRNMSVSLIGGTVDILKNISAVAVCPDDKWVAVQVGNVNTASDNKTWIMPLTNGIPDLTKRNVLTTFTKFSSRQVAFDAAGNLYGVNNGEESMRIWSPGGTSITTYSNDSSGLNASFSVVRVDPDIFTQPQSITRNAGTSAAFTVTATGSGVLKYQWTKNSADVAGATASSYTVSANVQQANAGTYAVVVTNSVFSGSITSAVATLTVVDTGPIIISDLPATKTVNAGVTNTFSVTTSGTDPRSYQWYFNDTPVAGATAASYTRQDVQNPNDAGTYAVVITNTIAPYATTSTPCALTINESIPVVTVNPANQTTGAGANVTFSVSSYGTDPRTYQWQLSGGDITGATDRTLTLTNVQVEQTGNSYSVNLSNPQGGPVSSTAAILTVTNRPPIIITQPSNAFAAVEASASFSVVAQGENPLTYQWNKAGAPITDATDSSLSFPSAQLTDAAFYSVVVTSTGGNTTSASAQLVITTTPFATGSGTGLRGEYRTTQAQTFTNAPTVTRIDANVDANYGTGSPDSSISVDNFTARWSGQVQPLYSQDYSFYTTTDDGSRLWVNGQLMVDTWIPQGGPEVASPTTITLVAGQQYDLVMEYFERAGSAQAHLLWSSASQVKQAIPMTQLYPAATPVQPKLNAVVLGTDLVLQWMGSYDIQSAPDLVTPFSSVITVTNIAPYTNGPMSQPEQFFRLRAY